MVEINITKNEENQRIDKFLLKYLNKAPSSFIHKMIRKKNIKVNKQKIEPNYILQNLDVVQIFFSDETINNFRQEKVIQKSKKIEIVFEDENILIVNKMAGVLSHSSDSNDIDTVVDRILYYLSEKGEFDPKSSYGFTPSICNRLDINTSGLIICGKNLSAVQELNEIFKKRLIKKYYITVVKGEVINNKTLKGYYVKNERDNEALILKYKPKTGDFKEVITIYDPIKTNKEYSLLKIQLVTGKSHQIRAHLKSEGLPIAGDRKYGDEEVNAYFRREFSQSNQLLHAKTLKFDIIEGQLSYLSNQEFNAEVPNKFAKVIKQLF